MNPPPPPPVEQEAARQAPAVCCDLCAWPMSLPEICVEQGEILGLLVCSQCIEDHLDATTDNARAEVGLVGGRG